MNKPYIEEILTYNDKISIYNLIYKKFKFKWWLIIVISPVIPAVFSFIFLAYKMYFWLFLALVLMTILVIKLLKFKDKKIRIIMRRDYRYALNTNNDFNYKSFLEIQKIEMIKLLGDDLVKKDNLLFLIDRLPAQQNKYSYAITIQTVIITISIVVAAFLSKFLDFATDMNDFINGSIILIITILMIAYIVIMIDLFIIKDFVQRHVKNKNRLVRTLNNIYLDKYVN